jgi:hypothetical protein
MASSNELTRRYQELLRGGWEFNQSHGLSAAVYTQTTDVETECNGLLTYDRAVLKVDALKVAAANRGQLPRRKLVVPTSAGDGITWRYTFEAPPDDWDQPGFDDSAWKTGPGGFGTKITPGTAVRTEWNGPHIWLRREFNLPEVKTEDLSLIVHHDDDVEISINGVPAAKATGATSTYETLPLNAKALAALRTGKNLLAVHCKQTTGGQYIDVGMVELSATSE